MPKKSRRVAVRQAELGQRKRRSHRPGGAQPAAQVSAPTVESPEPTTAPPEADAAPQPTVAPAPDMPRSVPQPAAPPAPPAPAPRPAAPYMMPELKRIGLIAALMLVILAVLTVALG